MKSQNLSSSEMLHEMIAHRQAFVEKATQLNPEYRIRFEELFCYVAHRDGVSIGKLPEPLLECVKKKTRWEKLLACNGSSSTNPIPEVIKPDHKAIEDLFDCLRRWCEKQEPSFKAYKLRQISSFVSDVEKFLRKNLRALESLYWEEMTGKFDALQAEIAANHLRSTVDKIQQLNIPPQLLEDLRLACRMVENIEHAYGEVLAHLSEVKNFSAEMAHDRNLIPPLRLKKIKGGRPPKGTKR